MARNQIQGKNGNILEPNSDGSVNVSQKGSNIAINSDGSIAENNVAEYRGLSTDTKPTTNVSKFSTFVEMDTNNIYYFDGSGWVIY